MAVSVIAYSERRDGNRWVLVERNVMDFHARNYSAFLAGLHNTSMVMPIAAPRGLPDDTSYSVAADYDAEDIEPSWLSVRELLAFDYDATFEDRRVARRVPEGWVDHAITGEAGEGVIVSYREFLGEEFFAALEKISRSGAERIVFWFSL